MRLDRDKLDLANQLCSVFPVLTLLYRKGYRKHQLGFVASFTDKHITVFWSSAGHRSYTHREFADGVKYFDFQRLDEREGRTERDGKRTSLPNRVPPQAD